MATSMRSSHGSLGQIAERQMRMSAIGLNVTDRLNDVAAQAALTKQIRPYVCISREAGSAGEEVGRHLARELSWQLLDQELIHSIAERGRLSETMLQLVDEAHWNWFLEAFCNGMLQQPVNQATFVLRLGELLRLATRETSAVIVGRGAQYLLPRDRGVAVRIIAPRELRLSRLMQERSCGEAEAAAHLDRTDASRDEFVHRFFHRDAKDVHGYDIVLNTGTFNPAEAAQMIANLCRSRFPI